MFAKVLILKKKTMTAIIDSSVLGTVLKLITYEVDTTTTISSLQERKSNPKEAK